MKLKWRVYVHFVEHYHSTHAAEIVTAIAPSGATPAAPKRTAPPPRELCTGVVNRLND